MTRLQLSQEDVLRAALGPRPSLCRDDPHVVIPEWMTAAQVDALNKLFDRNADGAVNRCEFFSRVTPYFGDYCGLRWCGMFIGIEKDGYTHS